MLKKPLLPHHVAIIMDGNGRWAQQQGKKRTVGHKAGAKRVKEIVRHAGEIGLPVLTLWGFSTDNWKRPQYEVNVLMGLFQQFIVREADELNAMSVRVTFIGRRSELPENLQRVMGQLEMQTQSNPGLKLQIALNYGGLQEVVDASNRLQRAGVAVTDESLMHEIYQHVVAPDLIIRTSGEYRTSGYQPLAVHAEWIFTDTLWPDFTTAEFDTLLRQFATRDRRCGGLSKK